MKDILKHRDTRAILILIGSIVVLLFVFGLGTLVGYRRGVFAAQFSSNYSHNFNPGFAGPGIRPMPFNMHGVAGEVIDVTSSTIAVKDQSGNEKSISISSSTLIRKGDLSIAASDLAAGDIVTIIGEPNEEGQIEARLIRVFMANQ